MEGGFKLYTKVMKKIPNFKVNCSFKGFLMIIVRTKTELGRILDEYRKKG